MEGKSIDYANPLIHVLLDKYLIILGSNCIRLASYLHGKNNIRDFSLVSLSTTIDTMQD